jgi:hypothetical protein
MEAAGARTGSRIARTAPIGGSGRKEDPWALS